MCRVVPPSGAEGVWKESESKKKRKEDEKEKNLKTQ
jgi:hypothetical protein